MIIDIECPLCRGKGFIRENQWPFGEECPRCGGTGAIAHDLNEDADDD